MRLRHEISLGITSLVVLQVATTIVATRMLSRSAPAVETILEENVSSLIAAEDILTQLAKTTVSPTRGRPDGVQLALDEARRHVEIPGEAEVIDKIEGHIDAALAGDPEARRGIVADVRDLTKLNRAAMRSADEQSRTSALAGAWATAFLGLASFWVSVIVSRRLRARLEAPLIELDSALDSVRRGERHRRVTLHTGPAEARRIADGVNWLLDRDESGMTRPPSDATVQRALALYALDRDPLPTVVVDAEGAIVATNKTALARLDGGPSGIPGGLRRVPPSDPARVIDGWAVEKLEGHELWVWRRTEPVDV